LTEKQYVETTSERKHFELLHCIIAFPLMDDMSSLVAMPVHSILVLILVDSVSNGEVAWVLEGHLRAILY
jgi:hypothetical protein